MKNILLLSFLTPYILGFLSPKPKNVRPPNTVEIVENFFFDETEIANIDWREYLSKLRVEHGKESEIYKAALPDTLVWRDELSNNSPFVNTYFNHPSFDSYPVVGISHEQAKTYCIWRTEVVKTMMKSHNIENVNFKYRLPTQTEWELVANAGYSDKQKKLFKKQNKKYKGKARTCNMIFDNESLKETVRMTRQTRNYLPNKYNVYNIYGNVAEMVAESNIAMGGSYRDKYDDIVPSNKVLNYEGPQKWLGFRCVAEYED